MLNYIRISKNLSSPVSGWGKFPRVFPKYSPELLSHCLTIWRSCPDGGFRFSQLFAPEYAPVQIGPAQISIVQISKIQVAVAQVSPCEICTA